MTLSVHTHLIRRAFEAAPAIQSNDDGLTQPEREALERLRSPKSIFILGATVLAYLVLSFLIEYTVRFVIGNLAIVEDAQPSDTSDTNDAGYHPIPNEKADLLELDDVETVAQASIPIKPITSTIRGALRHLRNTDGFKSYFRGLPVFLVYTFLYGTLNGLLFLITGAGPVSMLFSNIFTAVITSRLHCAWTHATIRAPSSQQPKPKALPTLHLESLNDKSETKAIAVPFYPEFARIGRQTESSDAASSNGIFDNKTISRQHAKVWADDTGAIWAQDSESANGTYINGHRLSAEGVVSPPHKLMDGDQIVFGVDILDETKTTTVHRGVSARISISEAPELEQTGLDKRCSIRYISQVDSRHVILPAVRVEIAIVLAQALTSMAFRFSRNRLGQQAVQAAQPQGCHMHMSPSSILFVLLPIVTLLATTLLLVVPAMIARIRIEASLLPESEQTVVPLDRTFGGRVDLSTESKLMYVKRQLTLPGAFLAFNFSAYRRVLSVWAKYHLILMALAFATVASLVAEVYVILGDLQPVGLVQDVVKRWNN